MPERDGYIAGVPCWIDTTQPDPNAALPFYGGLFGWEFEDVMPEGSPGRYFIGRIRGGDVAAVGSAPEGDATGGGLEHLHLGRQRGRGGVEGRRRRWHRGRRALRRARRRADGGVRRPGGGDVLECRRSRTRGPRSSTSTGR